MTDRQTGEDQEEQDGMDREGGNRTPWADRDRDRDRLVVVCCSCSSSSSACPALCSPLPVSSSLPFLPFSPSLFSSSPSLHAFLHSDRQFRQHLLLPFFLLFCGNEPTYHLILLLHTCLLLFYFCMHKLALGGLYEPERERRRRTGPNGGLEKT